MKIGIDRKNKAVFAVGDTWLMFFRLCRDLDGSWQLDGENLPLFGYLDEENITEKDLD